MKKYLPTNLYTRILNISLVLMSLFSFSASAQSTLCPSNANDQYYEWVTRIKINDGTRTSEKTGYADFTSSAISTLTAGQTYNVEIDVRTNNTPWHEYVKLWLDLNQDNIIQDPQELIFVKEATVNPFKTFTGTVTIPTTAFNGSMIGRMIMQYAASPALCGTYTYGTTYDVKVNVLGGVANPVNNTLTVSTTGSGTGFVTSSPEGINTANGVNSFDFPEDTNVTLTAISDTGSTFLNWSGAVSSTNTNVVVNLNSNKNISANFKSGVPPPVPPPIAIITASGPTSVCSPDSVLLTAGTASSYQWLLNNNTISGAISSSYVASQSGSYTVVVKNSAGVAATSVAKIITVNQLPTASITTDGPTTFCPSESVTLSASAGSSYLWNTGATTQTINVLTAGNYSVTVTNASGCAGVSTPTTIAVEDNEAPVTPVLADVTGECTATATAPTTTDNCAGIITGTTSDSLTYSTQGTHTITWNFNDGNGQNFNVTQNVIVNDTTDPSTPTLADVTGQCDATATVPTTTDDCVGPINGTTSDPLTYSAQGTHTITWNFNDGNGQNFNVTQNVIVNDTIAPAISATTDISLVATSAAGVVVNYTTPVGTDNCSVTTEMTSGLADGATFPIGTTVVTYVATDDSGNDASASFNVVVDGLAPVIVIPENITVITDVNECSAITQDISIDLDPFGFASITPGMIDDGSNDNCAVASVEFLTGTSGVELVTNGGFDSSLSDWTTSLSSIEYRVDGYVVLNGSGELSPDPSLAQVVNGFVVGETYIIRGDYKNSYNCCGAYTGQIAFGVDIDGNEIAALPNPGTTWSPFSVIFTATSTSHTVGFRGEINGTDTDIAIDNISIAVPITASAIDFDCSNVGQANQVTLLVTDVNGNSSTATATVTVLDEILPEITVPADITNVFATSAAGVVVNYTTPVGTDNCSVTTAMTSGLADGATFPIGTTVVTYVATDDSENTALASFNVVVVDGLAPVIMVPANITANTDANECGAIVPFAATDATGIPNSVITYDIQPDSLFEVGTTTVTATATNAVGTSISTFDVTVIDNQAPIAVAQDFTVTLDEYGNATITPKDVDNGSFDNCRFTTSLDVTTFDCSNIGVENTVILTVTDPSGNTADTTATVTVLEHFKETLDLRSLSSFEAFTGTGAITNAGTLTGDVGTNVGALTGFTGPNFNGSVHFNDALTAQAELDLLKVYIHLNNIPVTHPSANNAAHAPAFGSGETLTPGVYDIGGAGSVAGNLTLDGLGDPNAVFIMKFKGAFTAGAGSNIVLTNGADAANVFWVAQGALSVGANSVIKGTLLAYPGAITLGVNSSIEGRLLSSVGAITVGVGGTATMPGTMNLPINPMVSYTPAAAVNVLGSIENFSLFTSNGAVANASTSGILGDVGADVGAISGFATSAHIGSFYSADAVTAQAKIDLNNAYTQLMSIPTTVPNHTPAFGSGETLQAGVYSTPGAGSLAGIVTLDGGGNPDAIFIFKFNGAFAAAAQSKVILSNGTRRCNVFWISEGAASIGSFSTIKGTVLAHNGAATMGAGGNLEGRLLSTGGAIGFSTGVVYTVVHDVECDTYPEQRTSTKTAVLSVPDFIEETLVIYPNPSRGVFNIKLAVFNVETEIYLFDIRGKFIARKSISKENNSGDMIAIGNNNLSSGIYIVKIITKNKTVTKKLIVE